MQSLVKGVLGIVAAATLLAGCAPLQEFMDNVAQAPPDSSSGGSSASADGRRTEQDSASGSLSDVRMDVRLLPSGMIETGRGDAPVSLLLVTNHACAYCRDFQEDLMPRLIDEFIRPGTVRMSILPFTLQKYEESDRAARMLFCAAKQDKGPQMHDLLSSVSMDAAAFEASMHASGIDSAMLETCVNGGEAAGVVSLQQSFARALGITLVPSYFLNGRLYVGLPEYGDLRGQIEEAARGE